MRLLRVSAPLREIKPAPDFVSRRDAVYDGGQYNRGDHRGGTEMQRFKFSHSLRLKKLKRLHPNQSAKEASMALIQTVSPDQAEGKVREVYDMMMEKARVIPKPFEMMSPSPELLSLAGQSIACW